MKNSESLFRRAQHYIPGGVNSPVRAFNAVGGTPVFMKEARGAYIYDVDDRKFIDYLGSWGPMILGHSHPLVIEAVKKQVDCGLSFGTPTAPEVDLAVRVCELVPSIDSVRMVNSGTEAVMTAIRLARAATGRNLIIKFAGCYHGHMDALLTQAGSGLVTLGIPDSPGVPDSVTQHTLTLPYNDVEAVQAVFAERGREIAAVIVEPVAGNMNCVLPEADFLPALRTICDRNQALLIFDEVMTGFRVALGGAQSLYNVKPDLTTLGKIIGGGMPVGAVGGKSEIMELLAPSGPVYQAGTLSGNPVSMAAGLAVLSEIVKPSFYETLSARVKILTDALQENAAEHEIPLITQGAGAMFGFFFTSQKRVSNFEQSKACHHEMFRYFFRAMLENGVYLAPSPFEAVFMSAAHVETVLEKTIVAIRKSFAELVPVKI